MKISVVFSPVTKVSWKGQEWGAHWCGPLEPAQGLLGVRVAQAQQDAGWDLAMVAVGSQPRSSLGKTGRMPHLCLIDLQQHRAGSKAAVVQQHVSQDGHLGSRAPQGPRLCLQGLLWSVGQPCQWEVVKRPSEEAG